MYSKTKLIGQSTNRLLRQRHKLVEQILLSEKIIMGTMQRRLHRCRKNGCRCMDKKKPRLHGPYDYLAHRGGEKPGMLVIGPEQLSVAKKLCANYSIVWEIMRKISTINVELLRRKNGGF